MSKRYRIEGCDPAPSLSGNVESQFDPAFVQFDSVLPREQLDIELPRKAGADLVNIEGAFDIGQCLLRCHLIDVDQPCERALGVSGLDCKPDMFDLVAARAKADQSVEPLNQPVVVIDPFFVSFKNVSVTSPAAYLAKMAGCFERCLLQTVPSLWPHIGSHVAVPTGCRDQFDFELH